MLELKSHSTFHQISPTLLTNPIRKPQALITPFSGFIPTQTHSLSHLQLKSRRKNHRGAIKASSSEESNSSGAKEDPRLNFRWRELILDPDPDNVVAVGLTGALVWAGVQVLWQLFVVIMAIMIAAIKYTFVGVLLIFVNYCLYSFRLVKRCVLSSGDACSILVCSGAT
ncbi:hypothetical protein Hdeb2414_s0005g00175451 [Helianthus debilis subsp. tardiflorus]